jgi:hypothetical protein
MGSRSARLALSLTIAMFAVPGISAADDATGETLAYTCHGCHGIENYKNSFPVYSVPKLGGQHVAYLVVALKGYASQERPHATMHAQAASLSPLARRRKPRRPASRVTAPTVSAFCPSTRSCPVSIPTISSRRSRRTGPASVRTP